MWSLKTTFNKGEVSIEEIEEEVSIWLRLGGGRWRRLLGGAG
jgi:hypothetical protein